MITVSGTLTTGGVAQTVIAFRGIPFKGFCLRNVSTGSLWMNENATAAISATSLEIKPGEYYETPPTAPLFTVSVSIIGATTGQQWHGRYW